MAVRQRHRAITRSAPFVRFLSLEDGHTRTTILDWVDEPRITDMYAHQPTAEFPEDAGGETMWDAANRFGAETETWSHEEMTAKHREHDIGRAVLLGWDVETNTGNPPVPNDYAAEARDAHPEFFVEFGSMGPLKDDCVKEAVQCVGDLSLPGLKLQQIAQGFDPNDDKHRVLPDTIEDLSMPAIFYGGNSAPGACSPGGRDLKIRYGDPMLIDDAAAGHPDLQALIAHPVYSWEKEQPAICQQKGNVHMDFSGWLPKHIDEQVLHYAETVLQDKVMFDTDYPMIRPGRWFESFEEHSDASEEVKRKFLWENTERSLEL